MPIIIYLDHMMAQRKISLKDLAEEVGITHANLSTLEAICSALDCPPGDLLDYQKDEK